MTNSRAVITHLEAALALTDGLAASLTDDALGLYNGTAPSNPISGQFWCLVGARESYSRAIVASSWQGFACSLGSGAAERIVAVKAALNQSGAALLASLEAETPSDTAVRFAFGILEHEAMHHGQLIRYFYANRLPFPPAFARRYALTNPAGALPQTPQGK